MAPLCEAGVEHRFFWDVAMARAQSTGASPVMRRLDHREEIAAWVKACEPDLDAPKAQLREPCGRDFAYATPARYERERRTQIALRAITASQL